MEVMKLRREKRREEKIRCSWLAVGEERMGREWAARGVGLFPIMGAQGRIVTHLYYYCCSKIVVGLISCTIW